MFKIGDKIRTLGKLCPQATGIIVGVSKPDYIEFQFKQWGYVLTPWDNSCPNWRNLHIYAVKKDFCSEHTHACYEHSLYASFPEEDLELFDWINQMENQL